MKQLKLFTAILAASMLMSFSASAQGNGHNGWQEKIRSEKIAFITTSLDLTPEEAQVFWPVYNQIEKETMETNRAVRQSYKQLLEALKNEATSDKEIASLLNRYLDAKQAAADSRKGDVERLRKVLSTKKIAKLYIAEENFRRQNIRNMQGGQAKR